MPAILLPTVVTGTDVESAVMETLRPRMKSYCKIRKIPAPRAYVAADSFSTFPEDQLPAIVISSPGIADLPLKDGEGTYRAIWEVDVAAVCMANTDENTRKMSRLYAAYIRAIMVQEPSLHGFARGTAWRDEGYGLVPQEKRRSLGVCENTFHVEVGNVVSGFELPVLSLPPGQGGPGPTPTPSDYTVEEVLIGFNNVPITEEVNP